MHSVLGRNIPSERSMSASLTKHLYMCGRLVDTGAYASVVNPATEAKVGAVSVAGEEETEAALDGAAAAFGSWGAAPVAERVGWMHRLREAVMRHEEHLRYCVHLELGKPWAATFEDFEALVNSLEYYADEIQKIQPEPLADRDGTHAHTLFREPAGVVGAFLAWNFPLLNLAFKLGPAMAAGCPIVIKPSIKTPLSAYAVGELCHEIDLPPGVVNILAGDNQAVGDTICGSTIPAMLTLIGSTGTGKHIIGAGSTSIKRYSMELGGNAPALVFADADMDLAADIICAVKFGNSGQICVAPNRVLVEESVAAEFEKKVIDRANAVKVGFDRSGDIDMGPLVDGGAWKRVHGLVNEAVGRGARLVAGGGRPPGNERGHYYAPTVLADVTPSMALYNEEIFGPVVSLMTFGNEADAIDTANATDTGLSSFVFTSDADRADRCARALRFGEVQINGVKYHISLPHCGIKQSGVGVDCSYLALDDYLVPKRVTRALTG